MSSFVSSMYTRRDEIKALKSQLARQCWHMLLLKFQYKNLENSICNVTSLL